MKYIEYKKTLLFCFELSLPSNSLCAISGDWAQGWNILRLCCACSEYCRSWKVLSSLRSNPGPDSPWWVWLFSHTFSSYKSGKAGKWAFIHYSYLTDIFLFSFPQAPKTFMQMLMMMASSLWSLNALRWSRAASLFGPRITRLSLTPHAWPLSMNEESKYVFLDSRVTSRDLNDSTFLSSRLVPMCPCLQVKSHLQQYFPGGSGHLLLYGHQHWRHLLQLHAHRGGWVCPQSWHLCYFIQQTLFPWNLFSDVSCVLYWFISCI